MFLLQYPALGMGISAAALEPGADLSSGTVVDLFLAPAPGCPKIAWAETHFQSYVFWTSESTRTKSGEFPHFIFLASLNLEQIFVTADNVEHFPWKSWVLPKNKDQHLQQTKTYFPLQKAPVPGEWGPDSVMLEDASSWARAELCTCQHSEEMLVKASPRKMGTSSLAHCGSMTSAWPTWSSCRNLPIPATAGNHHHFFSKWKNTSLLN